MECGSETASALFWRGPSQHGCKECGGYLELVRHEEDRRSGIDRRRKRFLKRWPDWRNGADRRAPVPSENRARVAS
jgi:hypothetical protein